MTSSPEAGAPPVVAVIGGGRMGAAVAAGLRRAGWSAADVLVVEPQAARAAELAQSPGVTLIELAGAGRAAVVVVAVKPDQVLGVLDDVAGVVTAGSVVVSLAAGLPLRAMQPRLAHGVPLVRAMPNTPALVGAAVTALSPGVHAREEHVALVERVLGGVGRTLRVPESAQDAVTAVSGSGPAYVCYLAEAMEEAGVLLGLGRDTARDLTAATLLGAARLLTESGLTATQLREQVTSPAGTTAHALRVLDENAVRSAVANAMVAARDRSREIGALHDRQPRHD